MLSESARLTTIGGTRSGSDEAATKLNFLALGNITTKWKQPPKEWHAAKARLAIQFGSRFECDTLTVTP